MAWMSVSEEVGLRNFISGRGRSNGLGTCQSTAGFTNEMLSCNKKKGVYGTFTHLKLFMRISPSQYQISSNKKKSKNCLFFLFSALLFGGKYIFPNC